MVYPVTERMSHSRMRMIGECGEKARQKYVLNTPERPSVPMVAGKAVHNYIQDLELYRLDLVSEVPEWWEYLHAEVNRTELETGVPAEDFEVRGRKTKDRPDKETLIVWATDLGPDIIKRYEEFDWGDWAIAMLPGPGGELVPGIEYPIRLDEPYWHGYVDQFRIDRYGNVMALDVKTGQRIYKTVQLEEYGAVARMLGVRCVYGGYWDARKGEFTHRPLSWDTDTFVQYVEGRRTAFELGIYLPNVGDHCSWCSYRDACKFS